VTDRTAAALETLGLPAADLRALPDSPRAFRDGAQYRVEIPTTEGPFALAAILEEAERLSVPVTRISQGSGVFMCTDAELDEIASMGAHAGVEVSLFARPNAGWSASAMARSTVGPLVAPVAHGADQLAAVMDDVFRAADHGIRSVLIEDIARPLRLWRAAPRGTASSGYASEGVGDAARRESG